MCSLVTKVIHVFTLLYNKPEMEKDETKQQVKAKLSHLLDGFLVIHIAAQQYDTLSQPTSLALSSTINGV